MTIKTLKKMQKITKTSGIDLIRKYPYGTSSENRPSQS